MAYPGGGARALYERPDFGHGFHLGREP
jgi:hypothetical protein